MTIYTDRKVPHVFVTEKPFQLPPALVTIQGMRKGHPVYAGEAVVQTSTFAGRMIAKLTITGCLFKQQSNRPAAGNVPGRFQS